MVEEKGVFSLPNQEELSLYLHYPFCTKKCPYCHFFVLPKKEDNEKIWYQGILKELALYSPLLKERPPLTLYFGGGTPSLMPPEWVEEILSLVNPSTEVTLEINPEGMDRDKLKAFKKAGINRCSVGVQSLDAEELIFLGREHVPGTTTKLLKTLEEVGFENVSVDLMYDVPGQSFDSLKKSLEALLKLPFTHLSLYNLTIEPHTLFYKQRVALEKRRPAPEIARDQFLFVREKLADAGFEHYEISAFAKPGFKAVHNSGYWLGREFIGIGPSSFSYFDRIRTQNYPHLEKWRKAIEQGEKPISFSDPLPEEERRLELLALHLRWLEGVDLDVFQKKEGALPKRTFDALKKLEEKGLLQKGPKLTLDGILFFDDIAPEII